MEDAFTFLTGMEYGPGMKLNTETSTYIVATHVGSWVDPDSSDMTPVTNSLQHKNHQGHVSGAMAAPIRKLQVCLDENVSGVSVTRSQMLALGDDIFSAMEERTLSTVLCSLSCSGCASREAIEETKKRMRIFHDQLRILNYPNMKTAKVMEFDYLIVIDFEATCVPDDASFEHEIIEFPAVLVDVKKKTVGAKFQKYCKPRLNPILSSFCTSLTDITQAQVDQAKDFTVVLKSFEHWLRANRLTKPHKFAVVTDGSWDMAKFFKFQLELTGLAVPQWAKQWVNIRKVFRAFYETDYTTLLQMVHWSGLKFFGRPHCGLDDAMNIANVAIKLMENGCVFTYNEHFE